MDYTFKVRYDSYYKSDHIAETEAQINNCVEKHEKRVAEYLAKIEPIHQKNLPAIENNKKIREKIEFMMKAVGIPSSYTTYEYPTSRSKTKKSVGHTAGYIGDLHRTIIINDGYDLNKSAAEKSILAVKEEAKKRILKIRDVELQKEKEKKKTDAEKVLVHFRVKYDLPYDADESDILDAVLKKNKYLHLAHHLLENRNDWNDGPSYAERGLDQFVVDNDEDSEIHSEIYELIDNWDQDGRVFRDCEYNYGYLFSKVSESDPALYKDYETLKDRIDELS